jgi:hypothetical protein
MIEGSSVAELVLGSLVRIEVETEVAVVEEALVEAVV